MILHDDDILSNEPSEGGQHPGRRRLGPRATRRLGGLAVVLLVGVAIVLNQGGHSGADPDDVSPNGGSLVAATPSAIRIDSAHNLAVKAWYESGGRTAATALAGDFNRVTADSARQDSNALASDCSRLSSDAVSDQTFNPVPDPAAQTAWIVALGHLNLGAGACTYGATNHNDAQLSAGTYEMDTGSMGMQALVSRLDAIAAQPTRQ